MKNSNILKINNQYKNSILEKENYFLSNLKNLNNDYNAWINKNTINNEINTGHILNGIIYSLKDNITTSNILTTGGSLFLKNYIPTHDSTVYNLLKNTGANLLTKDNMDEFGLGGTGTFSAFGQLTNPIDKERIVGGSSSGSSVMVKKDLVSFSIGTDTGDSIRKPASFLGIVGFKPSYGMISRYGVYPYAPSMDHVGIIAKYITDIAIVFSTLNKFDKKDLTSIQMNKEYDFNNLKPDKSKKIAIIKQSLDYMLDNEKKIFIDYLFQLKNDGFSITEVDFNQTLIEAIDPIYKIISYSEANSCYSNLTGVTFGDDNNDYKNWKDLIVKNRTEKLGDQLKRRFVIGSYSIIGENFEKIYVKSKKIRTLIIDEINKILDQFDAYIIPGASRIAPLLSDFKNNISDSNFGDDLLQIANFAGLPSITIPAIEYLNNPLGINITSKNFNDETLLNIALAIEDFNNEKLVKNND